MKKLSLTLFLALICSVGFAQKQTIFKIDSLPAQGILLDKNWKWHAGDNPDFAKSDFDDSAWESIDPSQEVVNMTKIPNGINWFRQRLLIDQDLLNQIVLLVMQSGASEIFLNGKLIHKIGKISQNPSDIEVVNPRYKTFSFPCNNDSVQVLAVRFTLHPQMLYSRMFSHSYKFLNLRLITPYNATDVNYTLFGSNDERTVARLNLFLLLGVLYFALFLFNKSKKTYFYFSLYALSYAVVWYVFDLENKSEPLINWFYIDCFLLITQVLSVLVLLKAVYDLMEEKIGFLFYSIIIIGLLSIPSSIWLAKGFFLFSIGFFTMANLTILIISIKAFLGNIKGSWIIAIGGIVYLISWVMFILQIYGIISPNQPLNYFEIAFYSVPIAIAIYLGYESGLTNSILQQKLHENEKLATEKQQILSAQNETLEKQVTERTAELQHSLEKLKATQAQLIQSEKLASLGELTAGIAHEIQNPLNFVNNFAEMSVSLAKELKEEVEKPEMDKELILDLANDLTQNQEKINFHGKRASSIVSGMLEHSRTSTGERVLTDINKLADESLRLSYHGLRAKDKNGSTGRFNADFELIADPNLPKINVIPQDIGRVLLNIINNAFYAVASTSLSHRSDFNPKVTISTRCLSEAAGVPVEGIELRITDNGTGMSQATKAKIFQPFFTTKPTGQGTGLGLSLAYDIITKGHGGTIECESVEGEGTTFVVRLPTL